MQKGFTIIELIMVIVVIGILAWVGVASLLSGVDTWGFFSQRKEILTDARMALDMMSREMRIVKNSTSVTTANSTDFQFIDTGNTTVRYYLDSAIIKRTEDGTTNNLLDNVNNFGFGYYNSSDAEISTPVVAPSATDIKTIRISIAVEKNTSEPVNIVTTVWPRNL